MIVVVILGIIAAMVIPRVLHQTQKAKETEAVQSLGAIRSAELTLQDIAGQFVAAADEAGIRAALGLTVGGGFYQYKVINATPENFLAVATPLDFLDNWLKEIAMDKNGFVGYSPIGGSSFSGSGSSGGSSGGGSSGGGSGGGSSGSSGSGGLGYSSGGGGIATSIGSSVPTYTTLTEAAHVDTSFAAPTGLQLTANDGWLVLNFAGNTEADGYQIYRRENVAVPAGTPPTYTELTSGIVWGSSTWADSVSNTNSYCYGVRSLRKNTSSGSWSESEMSSEVCGQAAANSVYETKSTDAMTTLTDNSRSFSALLEPPALSVVGRTPSVWDDIVTYLETDGIPILFGKMHDITGTGGTETIVGEYNPIVHAIVINSTYATAPKEMIASIIAHEGMHALWDEDWDTGGKLFGRPPDTWVKPSTFVDPRSQNSLKQEYNSFVGGFQVWDVLQSKVTDPMDSAAIVLSNSWEETEKSFFSSGGNPLSFTNTSVTQFFSSMTVYSELLDY